MRFTRATAGALAMLASCSAHVAQVEAEARAQAQPRAIAFDRAETQVRASPAAPALRLTSPAFVDGGAIPITYSAYGKNISPPLAWSGAPASAKAFVLIVEDPDAPTPAPLVHWLAYDIPPTAAALNRGVRNTAEPTSPPGMLQGWNYHASYGYSGPRPPPGAPAHHYHFQLFALDQRLRVRPGAEPAQVIRALRGRVIARADLIGLYAEPTPKIDAPAPPPGAPDR